MDIIKNFPFFSIFLSMFGGTLSSVLPRKIARIANMVIMIVIAVMSLFSIHSDKKYSAN